MKFSLTWAFLSASASFASIDVVQAAETCHDVWAFDPNSDICAVGIGADYWGWTNGRYGTSGCLACECPDCPTEAPSPNTTPSPTLPPQPDAVPLPQQCVGHVASWSGDPHMRTFDGLKYDCQGEGEFHVLKSLDSTLEVQGRFVKFQQDKRPTGECISTSNFPRQRMITHIAPVFRLDQSPKV